MVARRRHGGLQPCLYWNSDCCFGDVPSDSRHLHLCCHLEVQEWIGDASSSTLLGWKSESRGGTGRKLNAGVGDN